MDEKSIINQFYESLRKTEKKKLKTIGRDKSLNGYLTKFSKLSIQIAKLKLFQRKKGDFFDEEQTLRKELDNLLNNNGQYEKVKSLSCNCPICNDTGYVNGKICKCFENVIKSRRFNFLNKDLPLSSFRFDNLNLNFYSDEKIPGQVYSYRENAKRIFSYCFNYAKNFSKESESLIISGETGLGKTHIVAAISGVLAEKGINVAYFLVPNLLQKMESNRFSDDKKFRDFNAEFISSFDCLVLDDFGEEFLTNFGMSAIYEILNARTENKLPTLLVTNLDIKRLDSRYSNKIVSRIIGNFINIRLFGEDIRQRKLDINLRGD